MATRAEVEAELIARTEKWMSEVGLDATTHDGTNSDLNSPIGYGVRKAGGTVASLNNATSAEVAGIADIDKLLDWAELRLLENILGNLELVDVSGLPMSHSGDQLGQRIAKAIERKRLMCQSLYPDETTGTILTSDAVTRVDGYSDDIASDEV